MPSRRPGTNTAVLVADLLSVLYRSDVLRSEFVRKEDRLGKVRCINKFESYLIIYSVWQIWPWHLYFLNLVQVSNSQVFFLIHQPEKIRSNDYSQNDCKSNLKAILLNKVVVGRGYKITHDLTSLTSPPAGYDSVSFIESLSCGRTWRMTSRFLLKKVEVWITTNS